MNIRVAIIIVMYILFLFVTVRTIIMENHYHNIWDAVRRYRKHCIMTAKPPMVNFEDVRRPMMMVFRVWEWGYTHFLPPYQYRLIEPYLFDKKEDDNYGIK